MQICDAMKFLRIAAVPVISIVIGVPAFVSARAQAKPSTAPAAPPGPVADLHCAGPKRLCRCACRMESRRSLANKYRIVRATRRGHRPWRRVIAHDGPFQLGQTGPDGSNMSMPYSAKLTDKLTMVFQQRAALNGNPAPQIKFLYAAPLQSLPAGFQCGVFVIAVIRDRHAR
jgi:hypothetical protein